METSVVRKRVSDTIEKAKRQAADRRIRGDEASRVYAEFLGTIAVPLFKQIANVLKVSGYPFSVFTPSGSVRLMSDRNTEDYIELSLDTSGDQPMVLGKSSRSRGRRVVEHEQAVAEQTVPNLTEEHVLLYVLRELEPLVER